MDTVSSLAFPVLAFAPNGIVPYSRYENLLSVTRREYDKGWFDNLELVDSSGVSAVVQSVRVLSRSPLSWLIGGTVSVEIVEAKMLAVYDVDAVRSRVLEFLSIYPDMYESSGLDEITEKVNRARTTEALVGVFC
jgi:hypothetical protein